MPKEQNIKKCKYMDDLERERKIIILINKLIPQSNMFLN